MYIYIQSSTHLSCMFASHEPISLLTNSVHMCKYTYIYMQSSTYIPFFMTASHVPISVLMNSMHMCE